MTICHGIPWYRNVVDDHFPFSIEGRWLFFYPLFYLTLTIYSCDFVLHGWISSKYFNNSLGVRGLKVRRRAGGGGEHMFSAFLL